MKHSLRTGNRVRLPAEWERQAGIMLTWPHPHGDWGEHYAHAHVEFIELASRIARFEPLLISCMDDAQQRTIAEELTSRGVPSDRVAYAICTSNDVWARDHGPITVYQDGMQPLMLDFAFNGWGGKFDSDLDDRITRNLHTLGVFGNTDCRRIDWILEGGSIDSDGQGTVLTTKHCLLADTRNTGTTEAQIEMQFAQRLGVTRILWLEHGELQGDDTDSHIDMLARFCDARTIAYVRCDDPDDYHYAPLQAMEQELKAFRTADGEPYRLLPLPWPRARQAEDGHRLPLSYANFLILDGAVIVPQYQDPADAAALDVLRSAFPDREIVGTPASILIGQHGSIHCVTMQLPAGVTVNGLGRVLK